MNPAFKKIKEIAAEAKLGEMDITKRGALSKIERMVTLHSEGQLDINDDFPYFGFQADVRIAAYSSEFLTDDRLTGLGDLFDPMYRIYDLSTRMPLFTALHSGRVILDQLADFDHNDAPDYVDAHFMRGEVELRPGFSHPLSEQELEFIHREAPEVINMLINESAAGA